MPTNTDICSDFETKADTPAERASFSVKESLYEYAFVYTWEGGFCWHSSNAWFIFTIRSISFSGSFSFEASSHRTRQSSDPLVSFMVPPGMDGNHAHFPIKHV